MHKAMISHQRNAYHSLTLEWHKLKVCQHQVLMSLCKLELSCVTDGNIKWYSYLGKMFGSFLYGYMHQLYNLAFPLLGIYPTGKKIFIHKETCKNIIPLVIAAPKWKQPNTHLWGEHIKKLWYFPTMDLLFSNKERWTIDTLNSVGESKTHYAE